MSKTFLAQKIKAKSIRFLKFIFRKLGIGITSYANLLYLQDKSNDRSLQNFEFIRTLNLANYEPMIQLISKSKSQLGQDLFVVSATQYKREGYFVEFGATNGIDLSNTYLLETEFSWTGILAEPAGVWKKQLEANRLNATIETLCIWKDSNSYLTFNETDTPELSTLDSFSYDDEHRNARRLGRKYKVHTISLNDLLVKHRAPKFIDYLSIDTEGSEYEILNAFNFKDFSFGIITVEHNYTPQRELIFDLLTSHGYKRQHEDLSGFDDWYIRI